MNAIFTIIIILSATIMIFWNGDNFLTALISASESGVKTAATLFCIYAVWMGLSAIAKESGLTKKISRIFTPLCKKIFKTSSDEAVENLSMNLSCNLLGIGGASTPFALKAMQELEKEKNTRAQKLLFVLNAAGIQLLPTTAIALRASLSSQSSGDVFFPTFLCSVISAFTALFHFFTFDKLCRR